LESRILTSILFFLLTITALGTVLYIYLRQEQSKNIFDETAKSSTPKILKSKTGYPQGVINFLRLIGLSIISGLLIASITFVEFQLSKGTDVVGLFIIMCFSVVQYFLVIPFTFAVYKIDSWMSSNVDTFIRAGIPLIFNILGASATSFYFWGTQLPDQRLTQQYTVTIKNETIVPWEHWDGYAGYAYRVDLHIQNVSQEVNPQMHIRIDTTEDSCCPLGEELIYSAQGQETIPTGESDIAVNIPIDEFDFLNKSDPRCDSTSVAKPLYLYYSVGYPNHKNSIIIDSNMSQQLLKFACESKP
jgi:hypothetical protein